LDLAELEIDPTNDEDDIFDSFTGMACEKKTPSFARFQAQRNEKITPQSWAKTMKR
jgi:hypothetical protein